MQLEADGLILARSLALELSQSLLVDFFKGLLSSCQTVDMGFQMKLSQCRLVGWLFQLLEQVVDAFGLLFKASSSQSAIVFQELR